MCEEDKTWAKALRYIETNDLEQLDNLLAAYPDVLEQTCTVNQDIPHTLVVAAAKYDKLEALQYLVGKGADLHRKYDSPNEQGFTVVHWAAINARVELLRYLDSQGVDMFAKTSKNNTGLSKAASIGKNRVDSIKYFKSIGCDSSLKLSLGNTLLHTAAYGGCLENFRCIYEEYNFSLYEPNDYGLTPAFIASGGGRPMLMYLESLGVNFNSMVNETHNYKNYAGWRAVHYATEKGSLESVQYLIDKCGCDPNAMTFQNSNCAMIAAGIKLDLMNYFIDNWKHDLTIVNKFGENSALIAAKHGKVDVFEQLLFKYKVNPFIVNAEGRTIYDFIREKDWEAGIMKHLDKLMEANWRKRGPLCILWNKTRNH
mmetsp:Transcript_2033/g.4644  ORF Transcript_2033/g.4644 Transcript_2033/m.4644 type:complete len:370 (-) Transcript_2033:90-1199(-)